MENINMLDKHKKILKGFTDDLSKIYHEDLISVLLYGSAASGEFVDKHSNLNLLVVLKNTGLAELKKSSKILRKLVKRFPEIVNNSVIVFKIKIFIPPFLFIYLN